MGRIMHSTSFNFKSMNIADRRVLLTVHRGIAVLASSAIKHLFYDLSYCLMTAQGPFNTAIMFTPLRYLLLDDNHSLREWTFRFSLDILAVPTGIVCAVFMHRFPDRSKWIVSGSKTASVMTFLSALIIVSIVSEYMYLVLLVGRCHHILQSFKLWYLNAYILAVQSSNVVLMPICFYMSACLLVSPCPLAQALYCGLMAMSCTSRKACYPVHTYASPVVVSNACTLKLSACLEIMIIIIIPVHIQTDGSRCWGSATRGKHEDFK